MGGGQWSPGASCSPALQPSSRQQLLQHLPLPPHPLCHSSGRGAQGVLLPAVWVGLGDPVILWERGLGLDAEDTGRELSGPWSSSVRRGTGPSALAAGLFCVVTQR